MRTGYNWYKISSDWLAKKSSNNLSSFITGTLSPGRYSDCIVENISKNKITVRHILTHKTIESSVFSLPPGIILGSRVDIQIALYGDFIIQIDGQGELRAVDPDSKRALHTVAAPSVDWIYEWAKQNGKQEQRPVIVRISES